MGETLAMPGQAEGTGTGELVCGGCGYSLRGMGEAGRCPECGRRYDAGVLIGDLVPWEQRRQVGRVRAYWQTVRMAVGRPGELAGKVGRPVSYRDAQRFRWVTVGLAVGSLVAAAGAWRARERIPVYWHIDLQYRPLSEAAVAMLWDPAYFWVTVAGVAGFVAMATGVPSYFFHPRRLPVAQQNRAVAISYYPCAPLAWVPVCAGIWACCLAAGAEAMSLTGIEGAVGMTATAVAGLTFAYSAGLAGYLLRKVTGAGVARSVATAAGIIVLWVMILVSCVVGVHLLVSLVDLSFSGRG